MNKKIIFALIGIILILGVITTVVLAKSNNNTNAVESVNNDQIEDTDDNLYDAALELPSCCY